MFLAVALPVLAALLASLSSVDLDLPPAGRRRDPRGPGAIPRVDTWTFTAAGLPWLDQQWGAQAILVGASTRSVAGRAWRSFARASSGVDLRSDPVDRASTRPVGEERGAWLTLGAFAVAAPALALRPQLLGMASSRSCCPRLGPAPPPARPLGDPGPRRSSGRTSTAASSSRQLVLGLAWLEDVAERGAGAHRTLLVALVSVVAACVTPFGPAVWGYAVGLSTNPEVTAPHHGVAADDASATATGILFFVSARRRRRADRPQRSRGPVADPGVARRLLRRSGSTRSAAWPGGPLRRAGRRRSACCRGAPTRPSPSTTADLATAQRRRGGRAAARRSRAAARCGARRTPGRAFPSAS